MVASSQTVKHHAEKIEQQGTAFMLSCKAVTDDLLMRTFSLCDPNTVEMMLISILGLEGLDCLRTAMQFFPETYLERRVPIVTNIVNEVLKGSGRGQLNVAQCSCFMSLLKQSCLQYTQRKVHPCAYDKELLSLTEKHKSGYSVFLGPPTKHCLNIACDRHQLSTYSAPTNVTVFTEDGQDRQQNFL